jgi:glycosyltransferase involved in cell wall biosynthesis
MTSQLPFITVIMPIRNEANFIAQSLGSVLQQDYPPECLEVLVVDGMSDDATRTIVQQIIDANASQEVPRRSTIRLLDNPARIVPTAFNIGLQYARGDIIVRVDGHCEIALDYLRRCVAVLQQTRAECVGGPMVTVGESQTARIIALAQSSPFGVGGVAFRTGRSQGGYVDTLAFGAYRREVFERIGGFDEELVRNQDDEFNFRLIQSGGKIWLDPSIRSVYYSRANLRGLWRQYYQYGFYKVRVIQKRGDIVSWRHLVPGGFVLGLVGSMVLALLTRQPRWALSVAGPYAAANVLTSLHMAGKEQNGRALPLLSLCFAVLHFAYGLGFLRGIWYWGISQYTIPK